jgi:hypothetical protein
MTSKTEAQHNHAEGISSTSCRACMDEGEDFIQRGRRGFSDSDLWSLDSYLAGLLARALPELAKFNNGCPAQLCEDGNVSEGFAQWHAILTEMAEGFAEFADDHDASRPKIKRSLELLAEWFGDLWD